MVKKAIAENDSNRRKDRPKCLVCGKTVNELGNTFCSSSCAAKVNSRGRIQSQTTKDKIGEKLRKIPKSRTCPICGKEFILNPNNNKTCSRSCGAKLAMVTRPMKDRAHKPMGGLRTGCDRNYRTGYYRGVYCASSYELAFVVDCFSRGVVVKRCKKILYFEWDGKKTRYYPDFEVEGIIYEVKGYFREKDAAKLSANPDVVLVGKSDIMKIKSSDPILKRVSWERITDLYDEIHGAFDYAA